MTCFPPSAAQGVPEDAEREGGGAGYVLCGDRIWGSLTAGWGSEEPMRNWRGTKHARELGDLPLWQGNHSWSSSAAPQGWHLTPLISPQETGQQSAWV